MSSFLAQTFSKLNKVFPQFLVKTDSLIKSAACFHTSPVNKGYEKQGSKRFLNHNKKIYPPQTLDETPRPAYICHAKQNIKYSPKKMWYIASFVRGMTVDEAVRQLNFCTKYGATWVRDTILEARELAVRDHNVEFKSNLWVAESFCGKGVVMKGIRRHARKRVGIVEYKYCHYYVRLEEGEPPKDYYNRIVTPEQQLDSYMDQMRKRKITNTL